MASTNLSDRIDTVPPLDINAVGYQKTIIKYYESKGIKYAIRAKSCAAIREQIKVLSESDWQSLLNKKGEPITGQACCRMVHESMMLKTLHKCQYPVLINRGLVV